MSRYVSRLCLCLLLLGSSASPAAPGLRPFQGRVTATWDNIFNGLGNPPANFVGSGPVSHMGKTTQTGTLTLGPPIAADIFPGQGKVTITAANGDQLILEFQGLLNAATGEGIGTFILNGGTGRFASATGSGNFYALIDLSLAANQPMAVVLDGQIDY